MQAYTTIKGDGYGELEVKRSRFLGYAKPVHSVEEAEAFISEIKSKHWDARHNVSAYVLKGGIQHSSDDGEPQGTAGRPTLTVILGKEVVDAVVVVTRYFGGVLLGTGGLVRAYSEAASLALENAGIVRMEPYTTLSLTCDYSLYGKLPSLIADFEGVIDDTRFTEDVTLSFSIPEGEVERFRQRLADASSGNCDATPTGCRFVERL